MYLSFFSLSFRFILWSGGTTKSTILQVFFFFLLIIMMSGRLAGIKWSICTLKSHRSLCVSFSRTGYWLCIYHLFVWSNWNFQHISQWTILPTESHLALYSFCGNFLHFLLCDWWFRLCHHIAYIYCFVASYLSSHWYTRWQFFSSVLADGISLKFQRKQIYSSL